MIPEVGYHVPMNLTDAQLQFETDMCMNMFKGDVAIDIETTGFDFTKERLLSIGIGSFTTTGGVQVWIYDGEEWGLEGLKSILRALWANPNINIGFHNGGNFDLPWLMHLFGLPYRLDWDTLLMHYSFCEQGLGGYNADFRDAASKGHGLKLLARHYLNVGGYDDGITFDPQTAADWDNLHKYLAIDVWNTLQLKRVFDAKIREEV
jgi:hypothetical protein